MSQKIRGGRGGFTCLNAHNASYTVIPHTQMAEDTDICIYNIDNESVFKENPNL